jgi:Piwi domain
LPSFASSFLTGTWDPRDDHFALAIELKNWAVVSLVDPRRVNVEYFIEELVKMGKKKGMNMAAPDRSCVPNFDRKSPDFGQIITQIKAAFEKRDKKNKLQMVMFIPDSPDMYAAIKRVGDVEMGVVTQVILGKTISKNTDRGMLQLVSNMLLKMNGKLGGTNSHVANFGQMAAPPALIKQTLTRFLAEVSLLNHPKFSSLTECSSFLIIEQIFFFF